MATKSKYDPAIHHRRSIRLKGYDYSSPGFYFVTICLQTRFRFLFGNVKNGIMVLTDAGSMVDKWYRKLESKFPAIQCREYAIMPNHFHCIIENTSTPRGVIHGADPIKFDGFDPGQFDQHLGIFGEHEGSPLSAVIQWFKTMTTNEYIRNVKTNGWLPFDRKLWQRNYYEHIVRSDKDLRRIQNYIINNPVVWGRDPEYSVVNY